MQHATGREFELMHIAQRSARTPYAVLRAGMRHPFFALEKTKVLTISQKKKGYVTSKKTTHTQNDNATSKQLHDYTTPTGRIPQ